MTYVSLVVDKRLRDYRVFVPATLDQTKPSALVLMLHGSPIDASGFEDLIHFDEEATVDEAAFAALIRGAVRLNRSAKDLGHLADGALRVTDPRERIGGS